MRYILTLAVISLSMAVLGLGQHLQKQTEATDRLVHEAQVLRTETKLTLEATKQVNKSVNELLEASALLRKDTNNLNRNLSK